MNLEHLDFSFHLLIYTPASLVGRGLFCTLLVPRPPFIKLAKYASKFSVGRSLAESCDAPCDVAGVGD